MKRMSSGVNYFTGQMKFKNVEEDKQVEIKKLDDVSEDSLTESSESSVTSEHESSENLDSTPEKSK